MLLRLSPRLLLARLPPLRPCLSCLPRTLSTSPSPSPPPPPSPSPSPSPPSPTWVDKHVPAHLSPYLKLARVDRPIGTWLLLWPCLWSSLLASPASLSLSALTSTFAPTAAAFTAGAFIMRGAGCTINDLWDRDVDGQVERTRSRPLASGAVSVPQALGFLAVQLAAGLGVLASFNEPTIYLAFASVPFFVTYPLLKRFTNWPQLGLGLTFNWGALVGWTAIAGTPDWSVMLPMYAAGVGWTLVYDTIYGHQDKRDDRKLGLKSTALYFAEDTKRILSGFAGLTVAGLAASGYMAGAGAPFYLVSVGASAAHLAWQLRSVDLDEPADCMAKFVSNKWFGALVFSGILLDKLTLFS